MRQVKGRHTFSRILEKNPWYGELVKELANEFAIGYVKGGTGKKDETKKSKVEKARVEKTRVEKSSDDKGNGAYFKNYLHELDLLYEKEIAIGNQIFPPFEETFKSLEYFPLEKTKVVILGQDPYHGSGQAHGLSFSVRPGVKLPPSLRNIYKELDADLHCQGKIPESGFLESWAKQGVLLLNSVLTVREGSASSHAKWNWQGFTDAVIKIVSKKSPACVFMLWGSHAQKKKILIDESRHCILESVHPSPLSAYRGFFGSKPFSKANDFLTSKGLSTVDWLSVTRS